MAHFGTNALHPAPHSLFVTMPNPPMQWRDIARDLANETDPEKARKLMSKLSAAFERQMNNDQPDDPLPAMIQSNGRLR